MTIYILYDEHLDFFFFLIGLFSIGLFTLDFHFLGAFEPVTFLDSPLCTILESTLFSSYLSLYLHLIFAS